MLGIYVFIGLASGVLCGPNWRGSPPYWNPYNQPAGNNAHPPHTPPQTHPSAPHDLPPPGHPPYPLPGSHGVPPHPHGSQPFPPYDHWFSQWQHWQQPQYPWQPWYGKPKGPKDTTPMTPMTPAPTPEPTPTAGPQTTVPTPEPTTASTTTTPEPTTTTTTTEPTTTTTEPTTTTPAPTTTTTTTTQEPTTPEPTPEPTPMTTMPTTMKPGKPMKPHRPYPSHPYRYKSQGCGEFPNSALRPTSDPDVYEICDNGIWIRMQCAPGTWFDPAHRVCNSVSGPYANYDSQEAHPNEYPDHGPRDTAHGTKPGCFVGDTKPVAKSTRQYIQCVSDPTGGTFWIRRECAWGTSFKRNTGTYSAMDYWPADIPWYIWQQIWNLNAYHEPFENAPDHGDFNYAVDSGDEPVESVPWYIQPSGAPEPPASRQITYHLAPGTGDKLAGSAKPGRKISISFSFDKKRR